MIRATIRRDWRVARSHRVPFVFDGLSVVVACALYYYLGRFATRRDSGVAFFAFVVAGLSVLRLNSALPRIMHNVSLGLTSGTLELLLSQARPGWRVMIAESAFELLRGLAQALLSVAVAVAVFGAPIRVTVPGVLGIGVGLLGAVVLFAGLGLCATALLFIFREAGGLATLSTILVPVLAGAYFPVSTMPQPFEAIADALPFSATVDVIRTGMLRGAFAQGPAAKMVIGSAVLVVLGALLVRHSTASSRAVGKLATW